MRVIVVGDEAPFLVFIERLALSLCPERREFLPDSAGLILSISFFGIVIDLFDCTAIFLPNVITAS